MLSGGGGIDPSPTNDLSVSGMKLWSRISLSLHPARGECGIRGCERSNSQSQGYQDDTRRDSEEPEDGSPPQCLCENTAEQRSEGGSEHRAPLEESHELASFSGFGDVGYRPRPNGDHS